MNRKAIRLKDYDYNSAGCYFVTICTKNREKLFGEITETEGDRLQIVLSAYGKTVCDQLETMKNFYEDVVIEKYVVMPNHIHLLIRQMGNDAGPSGTTVPTGFPNVSKLSRFVGTLKRFCSSRCGTQLWQARSHDRVVRNEAEYLKIWEYIETNPQKWLLDRFYEK